LDFIQKEYPEDTRSKIWNRLGQQYSAQFQQKINKRDWIDLNAFIALCQAIIDVVWDGKVEKAQELGYLSARQSLPSFYKVLYRLGDVDYVIGRASNIFNSYYQEAELSITEQHNDMVRLQITGLYDPTTIIIRRIVGFLRASIEISGGQLSELTWNQSEPIDGTWSIYMSWL
jgi:hypothetical protein